MQYHLFLTGSRAWKWVDGTDTSDYTFWSPGQPDSKDKADYCAYSWNSHDGYWDDRPCSEAVQYICQQQKSMIL